MRRGYYFMSDSILERWGRGSNQIQYSCFRLWERCGGRRASQIRSPRFSLNQSWKDRSSSKSRLSIYGVIPVIVSVLRLFLCNTDSVEGVQESGMWLSGKGGMKRTIVTGSSEIRVTDIGRLALGG